jgi:hypothetical protein
MVVRDSRAIQKNEILINNNTSKEEEEEEEEGKYRK